MRVGGRIGAAAGMAAFIVLTTSSLAHALAVTAPTSVDLGAVPSGTSSLSGRMGPVTATDSGTLLLLPSFVATVSATNFTTGSGSASETIGKASISYWSGSATSTSGSQTPVPGQATAALAVTLSAPRRAFSSSGLVATISTTWNPTIVVAIPPAAVAGTYTGTITHSVA